MIKINLIDDKHARDRFRIQQQFVLAFISVLLVTVGVLAWWQSLSIRETVLNSEVEDLRDVLKKQEDIRKEIKKMEANRQLLADIEVAVKRLIELREGPTRLIDKVNILLPKEVWLTRLTETVGKFTVEGFSFTNTSVAQFAKSIEEDDGFVNVVLTGVNQERVSDIALSKFSISFWSVWGKKLEDERIRREEEAKKNANK